MNRDNYQVIFNSFSAGGKTRNRKNLVLSLLTRYFSNNYDFHETASKDESTDIIKSLCSELFTNFIVVGGDGTIHQAINSLFINGKIFNPEIKLGIISSGTGQGFAKSFGIPPEIEKQVLVIKNGITKYSDLGRVKFQSNGKTDRIFVNEFQAGIGGEVVKSVHNRQKQLGGTLAYGFKTVLKAVSCPNRHMKIDINDRPVFDRKFLGLVAANGAYTGGSMNLAPGADTSDHSLDLLLMFAMNKMERIKAFTKIYSGRHLYSENFSCQKFSTLHISSVENVLTEADGEVLGYLPCSIEIIPSAIKIFHP